MKKIALYSTCLMLHFVGSAQFSFKENKTISTEAVIQQVPGTAGIVYSITDSLKKDAIIKKITKEIDSVLYLYHQKRLFVLSQDSIKNKREVIEQLNKKRDSIVAERDNRIRQINYWEKYDKVEEIHNDRPNNIHKTRNFFPAYYSSQAVRFFESDTFHLKLFQNNLINYNPKTKKMTLYTEAVNDYLGPLRVGIGFQIESESEVDSLSTADSTAKLEKKTDLMSALQNGGGDFSVNIKLPFIKTSNSEALIQSKFYLYANTGFSLPVLNKASDDFLFNYDLGIEGAFYAKGFNERLTFYAQLKGAYYNGNSNYKKVITDADKDDPTSFAMFQTSFGLDFLDGYRIRVDLFHGNDFVKKNFPATITFIVRPGKSKEK